MFSKSFLFAGSFINNTALPSIIHLGIFPLVIHLPGVVSNLLCRLVNVLAKIHVSHPVLHLSCLTMCWFQLTLPPNYSPEVCNFFCVWWYSCILSFSSFEKSPLFTAENPNILELFHPVIISFYFYCLCFNIWLYLLNPLHFNFCFWSKSPYLPLFIMSQTILQFCQDLYIVCCLLGFSFSKRGPSSSSSVFPLHISLYLIHLLLFELHLFTVLCPNYLWILVYFYYLYFLR